MSDTEERLRRDVIADMDTIIKKLKGDGDGPRPFEWISCTFLLALAREVLTFDHEGLAEDAFEAIKPVFAKRGVILSTKEIP